MSGPIRDDTTGGAALEAARRDKLRKIEEMGIDPLGQRFWMAVRAIAAIRGRASAPGTWLPAKRPGLRWPRSTRGWRTRMLSIRPARGIVPARPCPARSPPHPSTVETHRELRSSKAAGMGADFAQPVMTDLFGEAYLVQNGRVRDRFPPTQILVGPGGGHSGDAPVQGHGPVGPGGRGTVLLQRRRASCCFSTSTIGTGKIQILAGKAQVDERELGVGPVFRTWATSLGSTASWGGRSRAS